MCKECLRQIPTIPSACYRCGMATDKSKTCKGCKRVTKLSAMYAITKYEGYAKEAIWKLKFSGARAAAKDLGLAMAMKLELPEGALIVHTPTATSHIRTRGYDQACLLARVISRQTGCAYAPCLVRIGQQRQVGASRKQRFEQLVNAFRVAGGYDLQGTHVLLVDDVLTSGATLEAAADVLKRAGAKQIDAVVFARA